MNRRYPTGFVSRAACALLSLILIPSVAAADATADDWCFVVRIYGLIPSVDGDHQSGDKLVRNLSFSGLELGLVFRF